MRISLQGIRIRFGRSLVTMSGVVLGIAFLMSNVTAQLIQRSVAEEREVRQTVNLMLSLVQAEVGEVAGKRIAVAVFGPLGRAEEGLVAALRAAGPAELRLAGGAAGATPTRAFAKDAALLLVLGQAPRAEAKLSDLTDGMAQKVVLDSVRKREFAAGPDAGARREAFFGEQVDQQASDLAAERVQKQFRTRWIVIASLVLTVIGVSNALLMSVTERFREIGTMKCLGALSSFIRTLFLIESSLVGLAGSVIGAVLGAALSLVAYGFTYRFAVVFSALPVAWVAVAGAGAVAVGTILSVVAALYPASFAARMVPASALRSTV
jgi:hypothetical protein